MVCCKYLSPGETMKDGKTTILVVDDDRHTRRLIEIICRNEDYHLEFAENGQEALERLKAAQEDIHVILSDVMMPLMGGEDLLKAVRDLAPHIPVVLMTSHGSIDAAVRFLRIGAADYITKPLHKEVLIHRIKAVLGTYRLTEELDQLRRELGRHKGLEHIIGRSSALLDILKKIPSIAKTDASVVVYGESGTGKELIAKAIHYLSNRSENAFVTMNCGALPENLLETELFGYKKGAFTDATRDYDGLVKEADGGSLFLDEIGEISLNVQVKLLRFLQQKEYKPVGSTKVSYADVRFISATNRDLLKETKTGDFRKDLYYRLNIIPITLPSLWERREDIPILIDYFSRKFAAQVGRRNLHFHPKAIEKMISYRWPGNIRELENKILQAVVVNDTEVIMPDMIVLPENEEFEESSMVLPTELGPFKAAKNKVVSQFEKDYVSRMLTLHRGNISQAAKAAEIDRKNFWQKMQRYEINPKDYA